MRKRFDVNPCLNLTPVELGKLPLRSRNELPPILAGLQWIFKTSEINQQIFDLVSRDVAGNKKNTLDINLSTQQIIKSTCLQKTVVFEQTLDSLTGYFNSVIKFC